MSQFVILPLLLAAATLPVRAAFPGRPANFPGNAPGGFPGNAPSGFPGNAPGGFPGNAPGGFPGNRGRPGGFPGGGFDGPWGPISGAITDIYLTDGDFEPVQFAVQAINDMFAEQGDDQERQLVEILDAKSQLVAGRKFYLTLHLTGGAEDEFCDIEVVFARWIKPNETTPDGQKRLEVVNGPDCSTQKPLPAPPSRHSPVLMGGEYYIDRIDEYLLEALGFAIEAFNNRSNDLSIYKPNITAEEMTITGQVTAGHMYRFYDVPMTETECSKNQDAETDLDQCVRKEGGKEFPCYFKVFSTFMEPRLRLEEAQCLPSSE